MKNDKKFSNSILSKVVLSILILFAIAMAVGAVLVKNGTLYLSRTNEAIMSSIEQANHGETNEKEEKTFTQSMPKLIPEEEYVMEGNTITFLGDTENDTQFSITSNPEGEDTEKVFHDDKLIEAKKKAGQVSKYHSAYLAGTDLTTTLMAETSEDAITNQYVFHKAGTDRDLVTKIIIQTNQEVPTGNIVTVEGANADGSWDVSATENGSVKAWLVKKSNISYELVLGGNGIIEMTDGAYLFANYKNLTAIENMEYLTSSNVTDMRYMFYHCSSLKHLDLSQFKVNSVLQNNDCAFKDCTSLRTILLGKNFTVLNGTDMFKGCNSLVAIITQRSANNSSTDLIQLSTNTGLNTMPQVVLYVPNEASELNYEAGENYNVVFGNHRIKPILALVGDSSIEICKESNYIDKGCTVAGFSIPDSNNYTVYDYNLVVSGLPLDTVSPEIGTEKTITYSLKYGLETIMKVERKARISAFYTVSNESQTTYYFNLKDAVTAAKDGDTITLLQDKVENGAISIPKDITFDLQNHQLTTLLPIRIEQGNIVSVQGVTNGTSGTIVSNSGTTIIAKGTLSLGEDQTSVEGMAPKIQGKVVGIDATEGKLQFYGGVVVGDKNPSYTGKVSTITGKYVKVTRSGDKYEARIVMDTAPAIQGEYEGEKTVGATQDVKIQIKITTVASAINPEDFTQKDLQFLIGEEEIIPQKVQLQYDSTDINTISGSETHYYNLYFSGMTGNGTLRVRARANSVYNASEQGNVLVELLKLENGEYVTIDADGPDVSKAKIGLISPANGITDDGNYRAEIIDVVDKSGIKKYRWEIKAKDDTRWRLISEIESIDTSSTVSGRVTEEGSYEIRVMVSDIYDNISYSNIISFIYAKNSNFKAKPTITFEQDVVSKAQVNIKGIVKSTTKIEQAKVNLEDITSLLLIANEMVTSTTIGSASDEARGIRVNVTEEGKWQFRTEIIYVAKANTKYRFEVVDHNQNSVSAVYIVSDIERNETDIKYQILGATAFEKAKIIFTSNEDVILKEIPDGYAVDQAAMEVYTKEIVVTITDTTKKVLTKEVDRFTFVNNIGKEIVVEMEDIVESASRNVRTISEVKNENTLNAVYGEVTPDRAESLVGRMLTSRVLSNDTTESYYGINMNMANINVASDEELLVVTNLGNASHIRVKSQNGDLMELEAHMTESLAGGESASSNHNKTGVYVGNSLVTRDNSSSGNTFHVTITNR